MDHLPAAGGAEKAVPLGMKGKIRFLSYRLPLPSHQPFDGKGSDQIIQILVAE